MIHWLEWRDGTVLLLMAPYVDLKGRTVDFIALDGTVRSRSTRARRRQTPLPGR